MSSYDVAVIGLGAMGSSTLFHLARSGARVIGIDRYEVPHTYGSSHGGTRLIRLAYFEDASYVPLLRRAYFLWDELQNLAEETLLTRTGSIEAAPAGHDLFEGAYRSARQHSLPHEVISGAELNKRFPAFNLPDDHRVLYQPDGGYILCESSITASLRLARTFGAVVRCGEPVMHLRISPSQVSVETARERISVGSVVLCNGGWLPDLVPELSELLKVERQVMGWFVPVTARRSAGHAPDPVFNIIAASGRFGGVPGPNGTPWKLNLHNHLREISHPDRVIRHRTERDISVLREFVQGYLPHLTPEPTRSAVCFYTNTPDENFILDYHPRSRSVVIVSACSGHGFKFAPVIGEIAATMAEGSTPPFDLRLHTTQRFGLPNTAGDGL